MASVTFTDTDVNGGGSDTFNFTSTIGAGDGTRTIFAAVTARTNNTTALTITSMTIGGTAATEVVQHSISPDNSSVAGLFKISAAIMVDPNATSVTVHVVYSTTVNRGTSCSVAVTTDAINASAFDTATGDDPANGVATLTVGLNLDVPQNGFVIGLVSYYAEAGATAWTGLTEDYDAESSGGLSQYTAASLSNASAETNRTITAVHSGTTDHGTASGVAASFSPTVTAIAGDGLTAGLKLQRARLEA